MVDFVLSHTWTAWLALALIFLVVEMFTLEFTGLMLAVACLGGVALGFTNVPIWLQSVLVAILSLVLILALRPSLLKRLKQNSDKTKSNIEALDGLAGIVMSVIPKDGIGTVKLANGEIWTARSGHTDTGVSQLEIGQDIVVTAISGATAIVCLPPINKEES